jgi:hypothetical protein
MTCLLFAAILSLYELITFNFTCCLIFYCLLGLTTLWLALLNRNSAALSLLNDINMSGNDLFNYMLIQTHFAVWHCCHTDHRLAQQEIQSMLGLTGQSLDFDVASSLHQTDAHLPNISIMQIKNAMDHIQRQSNNRVAIILTLISTIICHHFNS